MLLAAQIATPHQSMEKKLLVVVAHTAIEGMIAVCQTLESRLFHDATELWSNALEISQELELTIIWNKPVWIPRPSP